MAEWDPDYDAIFEERLHRLEQIRKDDAWHHAYQYYKTHPIEAIEHWLTTYDPRNISKGLPAYIPLILFPKQREYVLWVQDRMEWQEDGIVEKSRDMGMTWVSVAISWWLWSFHPGAAVAFGSRKADLVDKLGDPKSILEKFRQLMRHLPEEMQPIGWKAKEHASYMKIVNPENGSTVTGEAGAEIGRGGRSTLYFVDEAAFIEEPDRVERALSENTECRIDVSTPNGAGGPFYRKRFSNEFPVFTFHWKDDPRKGPRWYAKKKRKLEPHVLAAEVDIDYEASAGDVTVPAAYVRASQQLYRLLKERDMLPERGPGIAGLDVGGGVAANVFIPRYGPVVGMSEEWTRDDSIDTAGKARDLAIEKGCRIVKYDSIGVGKGVTSAFRRIEDMKCQGVNTGKKPTRTRWEDGKRAKDKFRNLKAELWWTVRDGTKKAYELLLFLTGEEGIEHKIEDVILLPDDPALAAELPLPQYMRTESGLIQIESKEHMIKVRGIASPDHADALILTYAPEKVRTASSRVTGNF